MIKRINLTFLILLSIASFSYCKSATKELGYSTFNQILKDNVRNGLVNYKGVNVKQLDVYLLKIANAKIESQTKEIKLAFYINAYNAIVIRKVISQYAAIKDTPKGVTGVKDFFKEKSYTVLGKRISLNDLENKIIRPQFKDPRTHFALICAAKGCPKIPNKVFTAGNLDSFLDKRTVNYLNSSAGLKIDDKKKVLSISKIFLWYKGDFGDKGVPNKNLYPQGEFKGVRKFISHHRKDIKAKVENYSIGFIDYDWHLNKQ